ncbi:MAG: ABC transporter ATP-binding protein [Bacteroidales bacterium]|nr:MAG: ABC transporter ATP-binding protein [Bacteroidales bacterium]
MLKVENLSVRFGNITVLKDISFILKKGEILGVVGESGSGKSITSLSLMGLLPTQANIESGSAQIVFSDVESLDLLSLDEKRFQAIRGRRIAMIFQEPLTCLNPSMRCGKQLLEAVLLNSHFKGTPTKKRCIELLEEMQLPNPEKVYRSYPHELSGGQKQRVMIAMALSGNPELLIADEPTTALDVTVQKGLIQLLKSLRDKYQMGMIFISHDLGLIKEIADRVIILQNGKIVEQGVAKQIFESPQNPYTKGLLACKPPISYKPNRLLTVEDFINGNIGENEVEPEITTSRVKDILLYSVKNVITSFSTKKNIWGKSIAQFRAVDNVTLALYEGETLGIVGESGSGKTTLGRTLLNLIKSQSGSVLYKGVNLSQMDRKFSTQFRRDVQLIFQDPYSSLNPRKTVGQAISEPLKVHGICRNEKDRKSKVFELLSNVALPPDSYYRYPHEFSGGQRQRIVIARALAVNPKIIICDEIVSALDVSVQAQVLNLLKDIKDQLNLTLVFISHDLAVVKYISDRIIVLKNGILVESGTPDEIFNHPKTEYTKKLIDSIPGITRF